MTPQSRLTAALIALAGCRSQPPNEPPAAVPPPAEIRAAYRCDDGTLVDATYRNDSTPRLDLLIGDTRLTLPRQVSADGGRYADSTAEFWDKGQEARFTRGGTSTICRRTP